MYFINLVYLLLYKWCKAIKCSISGSLIVKGRTTFKKNDVYPFYKPSLLFLQLLHKLIKNVFYFTLLFKFFKTT